MDSPSKPAAPSDAEKKMRGCYFCCVWCVIVNGDISAAARYRIRSLQLWHAECVPSLVFQASECLFDSWGSAKKCIPVGEAQEQMSLRMTFTASFATPLLMAFTRVGYFVRCRQSMMMMMMIVVSVGHCGNMP